MRCCEIVVQWLQSYTHFTCVPYVVDLFHHRREIYSSIFRSKHRMVCRSLVFQTFLIFYIFQFLSSPFIPHTNPHVTNALFWNGNFFRFFFLNWIYERIDFNYLFCNFVTNMPHWSFVWRHSYYMHIAYCFEMFMVSTWYH